MRKLTPSYKAWLMNRQRNEQKRSGNRPQRALVHVFGPSGVILCQAPSRVTPLPSHFCLRENRDEVVAFVDSLRSRFVRPMRHRPMPRNPGRRRVIGNYFDFQRVHTISSSAALVLAAEYDRARLRTLSRTIMSQQERHNKNQNLIKLVDIHKWSPVIVRTLDQLGFFSLLEIEDLVPVSCRSSSHILRFRSGSKVDATATAELIEELDQLLSQLHITGSEEKIVHLQGRLIEAIQNVHDHAYPPNVRWRTPPAHRWWITASVDTTDNILHVVVYDQGISIPQSIPHSPWRREIMNSFRKTVGRDETEIRTEDDGFAIQAAFDVGRTETGQGHRGKGLMFMRELVDLCSEGELCVLSRNGGYLYCKDGISSAWSHEDSIGGTLVEWRLHL